MSAVSFNGFPIRVNPFDQFNPRVDFLIPHADETDRTDSNQSAICENPSDPLDQRAEFFALNFKFLTRIEPIELIFTD